MQKQKTEVVNGVQLYSEQFKGFVTAMIQTFEEKHGIVACFAGLFGSRAKGYASPQSDFDLYVPYFAQPDLYLKVFDIDTSQVDHTDNIPAQFTFIFNDDGVEHTVQLNFERIDHFMRELSKSNLDFLLAVNNPVVTYRGHELITLFKELVHLNFDLEKTKQVSLRRTTKSVNSIKNNHEISFSEVIDGLYRLLVSSYTTSNSNELVTAYGKTQRLTDLLESYTAEHGIDRQLNYVVNALLKKRSAGITTMSNQWKYHYVSVVERLLPAITARPVARVAEKQFERTIESKLRLVSKVNAAFAKFMLTQR